MNAFELQAAFNALGITPQLVVDGKIGAHTRQVILKFQGREGLVIDGIAGPKTIARLMEVLDRKSNGLPITQWMVRGICIRGLAGISPGMNSLDDKLNKIQGCSFTSTPQGIFFYDNLMGNFEALRAAHTFGAKIAVFGHSMGADEVWKLAVMLLNAGIPVAVAASFDPTCWGNNGGSSGQYIVPKNVGAAANFFQPIYPGGGRIVKAQGFSGVFMERQLPYSHIPLSSAPEAHKWCIDHVSEASLKS